MRLLFRLLLGLALVGLVAPLPVILAARALAQAPGVQATVAPGAQDTIQNIRIEGLQRIEPATVLSYLTVHQGDPFDPEALNASLKSLFATGLFGDVTLRREGSDLVVTVVENPIINRIAFEGNHSISDQTLLNEIQLRPRVVYTRTRVQGDVTRILDLYRRGGRFAATVEPKVITREQNRVDLVFEIDEGPSTGVRRISFVGNQAFSDGRLRGVIQTEESAWWRILSDNDTYDPDRLDADRELLRRFYLSHGYADFRVISAVAELSPDRRDFFITFTLDEGQRYRVGNVDIQSQLPDVNVDQLRALVTTRPGDWYSSDAVEATVDALTRALHDMQFAFVQIEPQATRNREQGTIDLVYQINEGPRVFVERIDIVGNIRTVDRVIRREMELVEGDPFNASQLRLSEQHIRDLGFFDKVNVTTQPGSAPDRVIVRVEVEEKATGELSLGAGYSTSEGPVGDISLRERNLLGQGQDLRLSTTLTGKTQEYNISFTEPYFLERDLAAGFDLFRVTRDVRSSSSYTEETNGFALRLGYPLGENLRQTLRYTLYQRDISDVSPFASRAVQEQAGTTITSAVSQQLIYEDLDSRIDPTDGYYLRLTNEVAGLGGDIHYLRTTVGAGYYTPLFFDNLILSLTAEAGYIFGFDEPVRIADRFFVGGNNLRGFKTSGIGPRDIASGDALGGKQFAVGTAELTFPLGLPEEFGLQGRAFTDIGYLTDVDEEGPEIVDKKTPRVSVGVGLSWASPLGPLRLDFGFPVVKEDFDETQTFRFSFGTRF